MINKTYDIFRETILSSEKGSLISFIYAFLRNFAINYKVVILKLTVSNNFKRQLENMTNKCNLNKIPKNQTVAK